MEKQRVDEHLWAPQGPLWAKFSTGTRPDSGRPWVTQVVEVDGIPGDELLRDPEHKHHEIVDILHWADWGRLEDIYKTIHRAAVAYFNPEPVTIRIVHKEEGRVIAVLQYCAPRGEQT
jgi:hypothetical protein